MMGGAVVPENPVRLLGRYALHGEIAVGGMATVHFGRLHGAIGFSRTVAIKRLHAQFARDPEFVSMFLDEARLAARIRHPNVVPTLDVVATDGELFVVMEYVHGESLARLIRQEVRAGRLIPPPIAASILSGSLQGLHAAHEARNERGAPLSIVHRDVSPQNILVGSDGVARVLDFGVAKAAGRIHTTQQGQIKGKLPYMAPEQLSPDGTVTRVIDVYAASVCLWEALTGKRLFSGENEAMILAQLLSMAVEPPSRFAPDISLALDQVVMRGLSRQPDKRFATAREMAVALERAVSRTASSAEVADWMESVAGAPLAARYRTVAAIELQTDAPSSEQLLHEISSMRKAPRTTGAVSASSLGGPASASPDHRMLGLDGSGPSQSAPLSPPSFASPKTGASRRFAKPALMALLVIACVLLGSLIAAFTGPGRGGTKPPPAPTATAPPTTREPPVRTIEPVPSATTRPEASSSSTATAPTASTKPPPPPRPTAAPAPRKNCDPPYSVDSSGRKKFKPECL
ncbi:serine/threonine-protein kinase [Pendulispora albinea]|uniref:Serine/threonine protein kinase n=1 Tax=Pendulispora albinea TaxID=2741071 RepID=A0ABZ2M677_9BACT